mgnify:CR=1 FL=1
MKLMILDGNSVINRAFYGIRPLTTREGFYTHAIYGFLTTMKRLCDETLRETGYLPEAEALWRAMLDEQPQRFDIMELPREGELFTLTMAAKEEEW